MQGVDKLWLLLIMMKNNVFADQLDFSCVS